MSEEGAPDLLVLRERDTHWTFQAACLDHDPDLFYPEEYLGVMRHRLEDEARKVCAACPVQAACLKDALDLKDTWGIRAGLTWPQRRKLLRAA